jgi:predicted nucleic acid-binding protein
MAAERYTFDTNILFYSIDARNAAKHSRARALIGLADSRRVPILLQTFGELSNAVSKRHSALLPQVEKLIHTASLLFAIIPMEFDDVAQALLIHGQHKIQFWDAVLWATARRAGCTTLFSEDMQDGQSIGGVTIRNPFQMSRSELDAFLA